MLDSEHIFKLAAENDVGMHDMAYDGIVPMTIDDENAALYLEAFRAIEKAARQEVLHKLYSIVRDDALAITYQSTGQYRTMLIQEIASLLKESNNDSNPST